MADCLSTLVGTDFLSLLSGRACMVSMFASTYQMDDEDTLPYLRMQSSNHPCNTSGTFRKSAASARPC